MAIITLGQAAQWCGGRIDSKYENVTFLGANNDSRHILPGQLFIALQGERDGHDYIPAAIKNGAAAVLCSRDVGDYPAIIVEDTRKALGDIAREERKRIGMKVVGVTGSVGKSTTKEMIAAVLGKAYTVSKTPANHNNDIGMPMAVLAMREDTQIAVLEMGMNHFREIAYLAGIAQPDVAVITNIGTMHIEHLGSQEGILEAKLEILEGMSQGGTVILNGDDGYLRKPIARSDLQIRYCGTENTDCDYLGCHATQAPGLLRFDVTCGNGSFPVEMALEGNHYVADALLAIGVGMELGMNPADIQAALSQFQNMAGRQEIFEAKGCTIIQDCYNAGPESMAAALAVLGARTGRRVAVLGDMLELGFRTQAEHYRVGRIAAENAQVLLAYGPNSSRMVSGAITGGMPDSRAKAFEGREEIVAAMKRMVLPGDTILIKGSRGMRMELILEQFLKEET